ncbi:unnamed protein product [Closterium sp. NIES-64]|nr:unnamed protein product [Closterium sp. NIES-64]
MAGAGSGPQVASGPGAGTARGATGRDGRCRAGTGGDGAAADGGASYGRHVTPQRAATGWYGRRWAGTGGKAAKAGRRGRDRRAAGPRHAPVRFLYCTDADGKVHKAVPCLYGYRADFPESSRASATLQQGSHRPCANCYVVKGELTMMVGKCDPRTSDQQADIVRQILACKKKDEADDVRKLWSTHPIECVLQRWNFADTEWGNVYLACLADTLHVLDSGLLIHMMDSYIKPLGKVEMRLLERHLLDNVKERGMPHHYSTEMWEHMHKGTVKGPVRGSNWSDIPRQVVEEEVQREVYREVAADAGGGR